MKHLTPGCVGIQPLYHTTIVNYSGKEFNLCIVEDSIVIPEEPITFNSYEDLIKFYPEQTGTLIVVNDNCFQDSIKNDPERISDLICMKYKE